MPPAAAQLCTILPPPGCFRGPFVTIDLLMDVFSRIQLPEHGKCLLFLTTNVYFQIEESVLIAEGFQLKLLLYRKYENF